jgi:NAD(P)-dependent dehydrogenase (short-subunit alcohol dehydrogenase family)
VYIITGATAGVGLSLAKLLYGLNATVYVGGRSLARCNQGIEAIKTSVSGAKGHLKPFAANLSDLRTIKPAVEAFLTEEYRLDVLFLNAGVRTTLPDSKTVNGYDLELGTHCLASFLLVSLLQPTMANVASHFCHPNQSIRVVWVSSLLNLSTPDGGVHLDEAGSPAQHKGMENYMQSKAGTYLLAHEFSSRQKQRPSPAAAPPTAPNERSHGNPFGVLHITLNPGYMKTGFQRSAPPPLRAVMSALFKGPQFGAYTELYAGIAPDVKDGDFVIPWGRKGEVPGHIVESTRAVDEVESVSKRFYEWCERQVKPFM